jgi:hypothetical protein
MLLMMQPFEIQNSCLDTSLQPLTRFLLFAALQIHKFTETQNEAPIIDFFRLRYVYKIHLLSTVFSFKRSTLPASYLYWEDERAVPVKFQSSKFSVSLFLFLRSLLRRLSPLLFYSVFKGLIVTPVIFCFSVRPCNSLFLQG